MYSSIHFLLAVPLVQSYVVWIDLNTFSDWDNVGQFQGTAGVWANVDARAAQISANFITEEELDIQGWDLCRAYISEFGHGPFSAMAYWETGAQCDENKCTIAPDEDIEKTKSICQTQEGLLVMTRAYWAPDQWQSRLQHALARSDVAGAVIEYDIDGANNRDDVADFVKYVTGLGKYAYLLWDSRPNYLTKVQSELDHIKNLGVNLADPHLGLVVGNYGQNVPWFGSGDTVKTVFDWLLQYSSSGSMAMRQNADEHPQASANSSHLGAIHV
jgi:DNA-binding transcriptional regulator of glucitol operon